MMRVVMLGQGFDCFHWKGCLITCQLSRPRTGPGRQAPGPGGPLRSSH
jgi:hypothetical protein